MVSAEALLSYPDSKLKFTVHTDASAKQLGAVIIQNNKKPQRNYTTTNKELLAIVECLKQLQEILFGFLLIA